MGFKDATVCFSRPDKTYNPGDVVSGRLKFNQEGHVKKCRGIYMKAKGFCKTHWITHHTRTVRGADGKSKSESYTKQHNGYETYFEHKEYLIGNASGEIHIKEGQHELPFEIRLPRRCPSSYDASDGHIRYQLKFVADKAYQVDQELLYSFIVIDKRDLNSDPGYRDTIDFEMRKTFCCWCMNSGKCFVEVHLPASGFCPGEVIPIQVKVDNQSSVEIEKIKLELKEKTTFHTTDDKRSYKSDIAKIKKGPVEENTVRSWTVDMEVPVLDPRNVDDCKYIDVEYEFEVTVATSGCHSDEEESSQIWIGHIPLRNTEPVPEEENNETVPLNNTLPHVSTFPAVSYPTPSPYPGQSPYPGTSPYPPSNQPISSPYPPNQHPSPYPPYPGNANPPYPNSNTNYGFNVPNNGTPHQGPMPYPSGPQGPQTSPYPPTSSPYGSSPYPMPQTSPYPPNTGDASSVPLLPAGTAIPYPMSPSNPYASASAPEPSTPDGLDSKSPESFNQTPKDNKKADNYNTPPK